MHGVDPFLLFTLLRHCEFCLSLSISFSALDIYCLTTLFSNFAYYVARNAAGDCIISVRFSGPYRLFIFFPFLVIFEERLLSTLCGRTSSVYVTAVYAWNTNSIAFLNCTLQIAYFSLNVIMRFLLINRFISLLCA